MWQAILILPQCPDQDVLNEKEFWNPHSQFDTFLITHLAFRASLIEEVAVKDVITNIVSIMAEDL